MSITKRFLQILFCLIFSFTMLPVLSGLPVLSEAGIIINSDDSDTLNIDTDDHISGETSSLYPIYIRNQLDTDFHISAINLELSSDSSDIFIFRIYDYTLNLLTEGVLGGEGSSPYVQTLYPNRDMSEESDQEQFIIEIDNRLNSDGQNFTIQLESHFGTVLQGYVRFDEDSLMPNASIEIFCQNSGETIYITADSEGQYSVLRCPIDIFEISVEYQGTWEALSPTYNCEDCELEYTDKDLNTTFQPPETVTTPAIPTGPSSGEAGQTLSYSSSDAASNLDHSIEYRFDWGDGTRSNWAPLVSASHAWQGSGSYNVKAQARCVAHPGIVSNWSDTLNMSINLPQEETINTPNIPTGPASSEAGQFLTYSSGGASSNLGHGVQYQFDWGDETQSEWASSATASHSYPTTGTFDIKAMVRCATHTNTVSSWSEVKTVTIHSQPETVSVPSTPVGPITVAAEQILTYTTGGTFSNIGHAVQYRFSWGDGTQSDWSLSTSASHSWSGEGLRNVRAQARCSNHISVISGWSEAITVSISPPPEAVTTPNTPSGPASGEFSKDIAYTTGGASSNLGHSLLYRFDWGDGTQSGWASSTSAIYAWPSSGTYEVKSQSKCATHADIVSSWSEVKSVTINPPPEMISTPHSPTGPFSGELGQNLTYSTGGASSNLGHSLQYRFDWGDGTQSAWSSSTSAFQSWASSGTYEVMAQAKCIAHTSVVSEWSASRTIDILEPPESVSLPDIPTGPASGEVAEELTFSTSGSLSNIAHNLQYRFDWGDGTQSEWSNADTVSYEWSGEGPYNIRAQARCAFHPSVISNWSGIKSVTINPPPETVNASNKPTGPSSGKMEQSLTFSTGGASSSEGHSLQYRFDWGDGTQSEWSTSTTASHYWTRPGIFNLRAEVRCATHTSIVSEPSSAKSVSIEASAETINAPNEPSGPSEGGLDQTLTYTTGGALSNLGHILQYRFDWGDRTQSGWTSSTSSTHTWSGPGSFNVKAQSRCALHPSIVSTWSAGKILEIISTSTTLVIPSEDNFNIGSSIDATGETQTGLVVMPAEGNNRIKILQNTQALNSEGAPLSTMQLLSVDPEEIPSVPLNRYMISKAFRLNPNGASFNPSVIITLEYDLILLPEGENAAPGAEDSITIAYYDPEAEQWVDYESIINTKSLTTTAQTNHGGTFVVLIDKAGASMVWAITGAVILSLVAIALIAYLVITRKEELQLAGQLVKSRISEAITKTPTDPPLNL